MVDSTRESGIKTIVYVRPKQRFQFPPNRLEPLVIEFDYAASMFDYGADIWGEVVITTASQPSESRIDGLYAYDSFRNDHAVGCRFEASSQNTICAWQQPGETAAEERAWEISFFQVIGETSFGGFPTDTDGWSVCAEGQSDTNCRTRFRLEITETSVAIYAGDVLYFEQTGLPALPADFFTEEGVFVYFGNVLSANVLSGSVARWHWDLISINSHGESQPGANISCATQSALCVILRLILEIFMAMF